MRTLNSIVFMRTEEISRERGDSYFQTDPGANSNIFCTHIDSVLGTNIEASSCTHQHHQKGSDTRLAHVYDTKDRFCMHVATRVTWRASVLVLSAVVSRSSNYLTAVAFTGTLLLISAEATAWLVSKRLAFACVKALEVYMCVCVCICMYVCV